MLINFSLHRGNTHRALVHDFIRDTHKPEKLLIPVSICVDMCVHMCMYVYICDCVYNGLWGKILDSFDDS